MSRTEARLKLLPKLLKQFMLTRFKRVRPQHPKRILIAHHLLLGDTLMLTPLLAKLRYNFPDAELFMCMQESIVPLYDGEPYGVQALGYNPKKAGTLITLFKQSGFDLAIVPGDNRYSWLAYAMGAKWIVAFAGDRPAYKNWPIDELKEYSPTPSPWPEMNLDLVDGVLPPTYQMSDWPLDQTHGNFPQNNYAIFHPGASSDTKFWGRDNWHDLATYLETQGLDIVWGGGPGEQSLIDQLDPERRFKSFAEKLSLKEYWALIKQSQLLVCPDTGIAHLGRHTGTPTICLFGPGSTKICGKSRFWEQMPYESISKSIDCRNQSILFKRDISWVQRCARSIEECPAERCMDLISVQDVQRLVGGLLNGQKASLST